MSSTSAGGTVTIACEAVTDRSPAVDDDSVGALRNRTHGGIQSHAVTEFVGNSLRDRHPHRRRPCSPAHRSRSRRAC